MGNHAKIMGNHGKILGEYGKFRGKIMGQFPIFFLVFSSEHLVKDFFYQERVRWVGKVEFFFEDFHGENEGNMRGKWFGTSV